ncbi:MAG: hypothetical protein J6129_00375 [Bacteroidaceae bacterium]|nr:hypothetical protein [Bacteroidaceae bacterium]
MKKLFVVVMIALMGVFAASCSGGGGIEKAKQIVQELKDKGANMNVEDLKAKLTEFAEALKPVMAKITEVTKKIEGESDPSKAMDMVNELKELGAEDIDALMSGMEDACKDIPAWKELEKDKDFQQNFLTTLGMDASNFTEQATEAVEDAAEDVSDAVEGAAEEVADAVKEVVE